jgi:anti-sigma factor RsiW
MNPKPDVHGYLLGELDEAGRKAVEQHLAADPTAAADAERLELAVRALKSMPEQEPPRRIAFVSDKVFEPNWWQRLWNSAPKLGFTAAAMLTAAILSHAMLTRPQPAVTPVAAGPSSAEIEQMIRKTVNAAVAEVRLEERNESAKLVAAALREAERRAARERDADRVAMEEALVVLRKQVARFYVASNDVGGLR